MEIKTKSKFKQLFCKHEYLEGNLQKKDGIKFTNISGETITVICKKCGKIKGSYFLEYEGMGYK